MPSEKQIEVAAKAIYANAKNTDARDIARIALTAAEQAEPAPAARSGAVKEIVEEVCEGWCKESGGRGSFRDCFGCRIHRDLSALEHAEPATDAEPVRQWPQFIYDSEGEPSTRPPESRLREALEWYAEQARLCRLIHSGGDAGRNALAKDGGAKARAALAQEDGR